MPSPPQLTDRRALESHRSRVTGLDALFLHAQVRCNIEERLTEVNREFTCPAIITPFPETWADFLPEATIVPDDDVLNLEPGRHDLVIHALALHWANDPVGQLVQARRALAPDGAIFATLFGGQTLAGMRACLAEAEVALTGGLSPRVLPMGEIRDLGALLQRAGFALPVADANVFPVSYDSLWHLMRDLRAMGEANAMADRRRSPTPRALFERAAELYAQRFSNETGRVVAEFDVIFLTGWAPAPSQPQPLKPGSATHRLADALGTSEFRAHDPVTGDRN